MKQAHLAIIKSNKKTYPQLFDISYGNFKKSKSTVSIFGIPTFTIIKQSTYTKIKLFDKIGLLKIKKDLI